MKLQLQSILLPTQNICDVEELYFHRDGEELLFDGYFNLFYIEKRKAYTNIENLSLKLTLKGFESLTLMHDETPVGYVSLEAGERIEYLIDLPYEMYDEGVFWFKVRKAEQEAGENGLPRMISGFYVTDIAEGKVREVNIGIDICTYKREDCVIRNIKQIKNDILFNDSLDAASHFYIYVIDNGKTLEDNPEVIALEEECGNKLKVFPNKNCGGAGGFTRGMIEVLNDKKKIGLTHVLLMDDDVILESDALVRTYGLLATLNDEWKDITVGGALLRDDFKYLLFAAGEEWRSYEAYNPVADTDLRTFENAAMPWLTEIGHEIEWYSGWWYCCYSLNMVREDNLPVPFFIHQDDIEYGIRNKNAGIVLLNGIGVWHRRPCLYEASINRYYDTRNILADISLHEQKRRQVIKSAFFLFKYITASAVRLRFNEVELTYQGFLDYLKGPEWLLKTDPEKINKKERSLSDGMEPLDNVLASLSDTDRAAAQRQISEYISEHGPDTVVIPKPGGKGGNLFYWLTYNGWIFPADKKEIKLVATTDSPFKGFRKERVLIYEPGTGKAMVGVRTKENIKKLLNIYRKTLALFVRYFKKACKNWQKNADKLMNKEAWEKYLEE